METVLGLLVGIGLSAACGFRVFVPLLVMSVAQRSGHLALSPGFAWIGSDPALVAFAVATAAEVVGYLVPIVDHALDTIALPVATVAGPVAMSGMVTGLSPFLRWSLAIVAGGGVAFATRAALATARVGSTATTGGCANPLVSLAESAFSLVAALLALVAPILAIALLLVVVVSVFRLASRVGARRRPLVKSGPEPEL